LLWTVMGVVEAPGAVELREHWLARWYHDRARPVLEGGASAALERLDRAMDRLQPGCTLSELRVVALGEAGTGKSTLLNTLLFGQLPILPRGGIGPRTARAVTLCWATDHSVRAHYARTPILRMLEALENPGPDSDQAFQRAHLLIKGDQYAVSPPGFVTACLRACVGGAPFPAQLGTEDRDRLAIVRQCLQSIRQDRPSLVIDASQDLPRFRRALEEHASGFLSPVTIDLEVGWNSRLLAEGLRFVDLPGLGVANDSFRDVTEDALAHADAVLLVVDCSGLTHAAADLLRRVRFFERALASARCAGGEPIELVVAIVKLDLPADDARQLSRITNDPRHLHWRDHLAECCRQGVTTVTGQLRHELLDAAGRAHGDPSAVDRVLRNAWVGGVVSHEHVRLLRADAEEPARVCELEEAGVVPLARAFAERAHRHRTDVAAWLGQALRDIAERGHSGSMRQAARLLTCELDELRRAQSRKDPTI
jgi:signal recognition particle receptor subunit beta